MSPRGAPWTAPINSSISPISGASRPPRGMGRRMSAQVAQLVEQRTENPRVGGSNPPLGTIHFLLLIISIS